MPDVGIMVFAPLFLIFPEYFNQGTVDRSEFTEEKVSEPIIADKKKSNEEQVNDLNKTDLNDRTQKNPFQACFYYAILQKLTIKRRVLNLKLYLHKKF